LADTGRPQNPDTSRGTTHGTSTQTQAASQWYAPWARINCEHLVPDQLAARGYHGFLPMVERWTRRGGFRHSSHTPMFLDYLFLRHAMTDGSYIDVCGAQGLVRILGEEWDRLGVVPDEEIGAIGRLAAAGVPTMPHPYLREGQRVRITAGSC